MSEAGLTEALSVIARHVDDARTIQKTCVVCGSVFIVKSPSHRQITCSDKCAVEQLHRRARGYRSVPQTQARREKARKYARDKFQKRKLSALEHYGPTPPRCYCCGFDGLWALSLDHVQGGGSAHRRLLKAPSGEGFYKALETLGWPSDPPLRVACMNCQFGAKNNGGVCPCRKFWT